MYAHRNKIKKEKRKDLCDSDAENTFQCDKGVTPKEIIALAHSGLVSTLKSQ
jgi:hypothetical protein